MKRETSYQNLPSVFDHRLKNYKLRSAMSGFYNYNMNNTNCMDVEQLRDELIKVKSEYNKKNQDYHQLKIAYAKLNETNLENCKVIEKLIKEANRNLAARAEDPIDEDKQSDDKITSIIGANMSEESLKKTTTHYYNQRLLNEIMNLRQDISKKETMIQTLKSNSKVLKYSEINSKYAKTFQELVDLTKKYNKSIENQRKVEENNRELLEVIDYYRSENKKQSNSLDRMRQERERELQKRKEEIEREEKLQEEKKKQKEMKLKKEKSEMVQKEKKDNEMMKSYEMKLKSKNKQIFELEDKIEELEKENEELKYKLSPDKERKDKEELAKLKKENRKLDNEKKQLEQDKINLYDINSKLKEDLEKKNKPAFVNIPIIERKYKKLEQDYEELQETNEKLKKEKKKLEQDKEQLNQDLQDKYDDISSLESKIYKLNEDVHNKDETITKLQKEIEELKKMTMKHKKKKIKENNNNINNNGQSFFVTGDIAHSERGNNVQNEVNKGNDGVEEGKQEEDKQHNEQQGNNNNENDVVIKDDKDVVNHGDNNENGIVNVIVKEDNNNDNDDHRLILNKTYHNGIVEDNQDKQSAGLLVSINQNESFKENNEEHHEIHNIEVDGDNNENDNNNNNNSDDNNSNSAYNFEESKQDHTNPLENPNKSSDELINIQNISNSQNE